ncbi:MAG: hypothetical protein ACRDZQ_13880 [Acidimicrobiales bacterium]
MKLKVAVIILLLLAIFPALVTGVAQEAVHAALQALSHLVGAPHG